MDILSKDLNLVINVWRLSHTKKRETLGLDLKTSEKSRNISGENRGYPHCVGGHPSNKSHEHYSPPLLLP